MLMYLAALIGSAVTEDTSLLSAHLIFSIFAAPSLLIMIWSLRRDYKRFRLFQSVAHDLSESQFIPEWTSMGDLGLLDWCINPKADRVVKCGIRWSDKIVIDYEESRATNRLIFLLLRTHSRIRTRQTLMISKDLKPQFTKNHLASEKEIREFLQLT